MFFDELGEVVETGCWGGLGGGIGGSGEMGRGEKVGGDTDCESEEGEAEKEAEVAD